MYLAHTAHWQFMGLMFGTLAWILIMATAGLNDWRMWNVANVSVIDSGVAWVGIWRSCFYSHLLPSMENCYTMSISDPYVPTEISVAQVLMMLAVTSGLAANITAIVAMRMVYFTMHYRRNIRLVFVLAGALYLITGTLPLVPLVWTLSAVLNNSTIDFPPESHFPSAPVRQHAGMAIAVGISASILMILSGLVFLCYRYAWRDLSSAAPWQHRVDRTEAGLPQKPGLSYGKNHGIDNPVFRSEQIS
ncbi:claudin-34 [Mugil cephalus]|uniref:claudin-34 n=1 Tax=Mugil cephalus TaxID=48193 RepID=UPI001FB5CFBD|nr:claudin-34 [Mugil cephalus]XP_047444028.1 claudin-34 [Mugil cephalus]